MKILLFEWFLGGGALYDSQPVAEDESMLLQGLAMWQALRADFQAAGHRVHGTLDYRLQNRIESTDLRILRTGSTLPRVLEEQAQAADAILLIAPESGGRLLTAVNWLTEHASRMISPRRELVALGSSKHATSEWLRTHGVQSFAGVHWQAGQSWPPPLALPAVIKPDDGAGGVGLTIVNEWTDAPAPADGEWRCEPRLFGLPVSLAAICHPQGFVMLEPVQQLFSPQQFGAFIGGQYPVSDPVRILARKLVGAAIRSLPDPVGFIGFDMVIDAAQGAATIIELNPRLTCSYLGLRQRCGTNLATLLLEPNSEVIAWGDQPLEFFIS